MRPAVNHGYLQPGTMFYRALSLPEVLVVLCGLGMVIRSSTLAPPSRGREGRKGGGYPSLLDFSILLLSLAAVVASIAAADGLSALFELRAVFLIPALYYVLLRLARLDDQARWRLVDGLVLGGTAMAIIGLAQYTMGINVVIAEGGLPRLQSVYPSPNNVGLYLGRVWPLLVAVGLWGKRGRRRLLFKLALLLGHGTVAVGLGPHHQDGHHGQDQCEQQGGLWWTEDPGGGP